MSLKKVKVLLSRIRGIFPSATPVGSLEFDSWAQSIIDTYEPPGDERSIKFGLCALLMRLNPTEAYKPKLFFALCLHKGASAQVAAFKMEEIKHKQKEEFEAAKAKAEEEAKVLNEPQELAVV